MPNPNGIGKISPNFGAKGNLLQDVDVFLCIGDSVMAQGYMPISYWDITLQVPIIGSTWSRHLFCHQGNEPASYSINENLQTLSAFTVPPQPSLRGTWFLELGKKLITTGYKPVFLVYAQGGSNPDFYNPAIVGNHSNEVISFMTGFTGQMKIRRLFLIEYLGTNGGGTTGIVAGLTSINAFFRTYYPNLKIATCQMPQSWVQNPRMQAIVDGIQTYVASDPLSRIAYYNLATFADNGYPNPVQGLVNGVHPDQPSGTKLATGPDDANTISIYTAIQQLAAL